MPMPLAEIIKVKCENCGKEFEYKNIKRNRNRKFCSGHCAKVHNGKANAGRKLSEEHKQQLSERNKGSGNPFYGKIHTEKTKKLMRKPRPGQQGPNSPKWKGGTKTRPDGYIRDSRTDKYIHRIVMEQFLGRELFSWESVHHINGDPKDNRIENLKLMTNSEHRKLEVRSEKRSEDGRFST